MSPPNQFSRRDLLGMMLGRKKVQAAEAGISGIDPLAVRADNLFRAQQYLEAEALYVELIEREPEHLEARHRRAVCLMRAGRNPEARAAWDDVLSRLPDDPRAVLYQGLSHAAEGSVDEAVETWRRYRNYQQVALQREVNLIVALADEGDSPAAEALVERIEAALAGKKP